MLGFLLIVQEHKPGGRSAQKRK